MPRPGLHSYSKRRTPNDYSNNAFDKLIQDVSNNTVKKPKPSIPIIHESSDENVYNMFDEPKLVTLSSNSKKPATKKNSKNDLNVLKPSFFKTKKGNKRTVEVEDRQEKLVDNKNKQIIRPKRSKVNLKKESGSENEDVDAKNKSNSSSTVQSSTNGSTTTGFEADEYSLLDLNRVSKTLTVTEKMAIVEEKPKQQSLFFSKSKSSLSCFNRAKNVDMKNEDSDSDESKEFENIIKAKFKLTKSHSDTSSLATNSPNSSLNSSSFNEKESPKLFVPKRIFSCNQAKKVSISHQLFLLIQLIHLKTL